MIVRRVTPSGVITEPFDRIIIELTYEVAGLWPDFVTLTVTSPTGKMWTAVSNGQVWGAGWAGTILPVVIENAPELTITITEWPDELESPALLTFAVTVLDEGAA